jgi:hypothetical protein
MNISSANGFMRHFSYFRRENFLILPIVTQGKSFFSPRRNEANEDAQVFSFFLGKTWRS